MRWLILLTCPVIVTLWKCHNEVNLTCWPIQMVCHTWQPPVLKRANQREARIPNKQYNQFTRMNFSMPRWTSRQKDQISKFWRSANKVGMRHSLDESVPLFGFVLQARVEITFTFIALEISDFVFLVANPEMSILGIAFFLCEGRLFLLLFFFFLFSLLL